MVEVIPKGVSLGRPQGIRAGGLGKARKAALFFRYREGGGSQSTANGYHPVVFLIGTRKIPSDFSVIFSP
jgi:hypothetical protein